MKKIVLWLLVVGLLVPAVGWAGHHKYWFTLPSCYRGDNPFFPDLCDQNPLSPECHICSRYIVVSSTGSVGTFVIRAREGYPPYSIVHESAEFTIYNNGYIGPRDLYGLLAAEGWGAYYPLLEIDVTLPRGATPNVYFIITDPEGNNPMIIFPMEKSGLKK